MVSFGKKRITPLTAYSPPNKPPPSSRKKNHKLKLVEVLPIHNTESQYTLLKVVNLLKLHCSTKVFTSHTANKCLHSTLLAGLPDTMSSSLYYFYLEPALGLGQSKMLLS